MAGRKALLRYVLRPPIAQERLERIERLCRYITRPPLSQERLSRRADGRLELELKKAWRDGTRALVLEPFDLLTRLVASVPPPRLHLLRYFSGSFEPLGAAPASRSGHPCDPAQRRPPAASLVINSAFPPSVATRTRTTTYPHHATVGPSHRRGSTKQRPYSFVFTTIDNRAPSAIGKFRFDNGRAAGGSRGTDAPSAAGSRQADNSTSPVTSGQASCTARARSASCRLDTENSPVPDRWAAGIGASLGIGWNGR